MKKKLLSVLLCAAMALSMTACGQGKANEENDGEGTSPLVGDSSEEYYMISFLSGIDYWKTCYTGMEDAAKLYGVSAQYTGQTDSDVAGQVSVLEQVIAKQPKGIAISCVNSTALADTINSAIDQGIQVVTFDSDSPTSNRASYLSTGNEEAGQKAAEYLAPQINNKGKVAILYTVGTENAEARVAGFKAWCAENAPGIGFVEVNDAGDTTTATDNMAAALQANNDISAVFCVDGIAGTAGPTAVKEASKSDLKVLAFDVDKTVLDMIKSGDIDATVAQGQYNMGYWSMVMLYTQAHNLSNAALPGFVDTGVTIVTKDTVDDYYVK
ncbi:substrate-binding domain-containing protein [Muricomes intestini]|uniref:substrate-binding domain-containing protein n=1 Tax=Muricomes intestini TaxID=1796634 RepID=UPI002FE3A081